MQLNLVDQQQLAELLKAEERSLIISLVIRTDQNRNLLRKDKDGNRNPLLDDGVFKVTQLSGMINTEYQNSVNNQRKREIEGTRRKFREFKAEQLWNGKARRVSRSIVQHVDTEALYLCFYPRNDEAGKVQSTQSQFETGNGELLRPSDVYPWMRKRSSGSKAQGTEKEIPWRVIAFDSIRNITLHKVCYWIRQDGESQAAAKRRILGQETAKAG